MGGLFLRRKLARSDLIQGQYIFKFYNLKNICSWIIANKMKKMMAGLGLVYNATYHLYILLQ